MAMELFSNLIIEKYIVIGGTLMLYRGNERMEWIKLRKRLKGRRYIYIFFFITMIITN